ncbi:glycohydrolase toxin TNT-related protein [Cryobacterium sp. PH31-O1]|uniref:glycohydrolase toxin TNT-related protein n=1 Tax=Cryobacterium sp. PH31-O1 TaxID=3046306 RepID=UPI0024BBC6C2|nr:glycohydrolase toxin TNT-related protein [Cryobacterium sp. PH31-O1]MDJ0338453.1 glycohydrolase toxin TNT-related protein [Cryobacterium sp. PH31-O1]
MAAQMCLVDGDLIQPDLIPGADIDPATLAGSATGFSTAGTAVTEKGAAVVTQWAGLSGVYVAPESAELLEVMAPVAMDSAALGQTFASVSTIIANFADDVAPVKARLAIIREEARAFVARVSDGVTVTMGDSDHPLWLLGLSAPTAAEMSPTVITWREHKPSVEENKDLIHRVNVEVAALDTVRVDCVNAINALRTDVCVVDGVAVAVADLDGDGVSLPWGAATDGDRSGLESFGDGAWGSLVGMWQGATSLVGFNAVTGEGGDGALAGQAWSGVGMLLVGIVSYSQYSPNSPGRVTDDLPVGVNPVADYMRASTEQVDAALLALVAADTWAENPAEAAGAVLVNVGTLFIGGGAGAGVKAGSIGGRAASIVGHVAEFAVPFGSWGVRGATAGLLHAGQGLAVVTDAAKASLVSGVGAARGALAQAMHSLADSIPTVRVEPGLSGVTPNGAVLFEPPRVVVGEPGSGGQALHSTADQMDAPVTDPGVPPAPNGPGGEYPSRPNSRSDHTAPSNGTHDGWTNTDGLGAADSGRDGDYDAIRNDGSWTPEPGQSDPASDPRSPHYNPDPFQHAGQRPRAEGPMYSPDDTGDGWKRVPDERISLRGFGEPHVDHGHVESWFQKPVAVTNPETQRIIGHPEAPNGWDEAGQPLDRQNWDQRYAKPDSSDGDPGGVRWPGNDGAVNGTRVEYSSMEALLRDYPEFQHLDRLGRDGGDYLTVYGTQFEQRGLTPGHTAFDYNDYQLASALPENVKVEVSIVAPANGFPGGGWQVRFWDENLGDWLSVEDLKKPNLRLLQ